MGYGGCSLRGTAWVCRVRSRGGLPPTCSRLCEAALEVRPAAARDVGRLLFPQIRSPAAAAAFIFILAPVLVGCLRPVLLLPAKRSGLSSRGRQFLLDVQRLLLPQKPPGGGICPVHSLVHPPSPSLEARWNRLRGIAPESGSPDSHGPRFIESDYLPGNKGVRRFPVADF